MTDSKRKRQIEGAAPAPPGKRERLVAAASQLAHRQGVARTTLADIAEAADVPLGNVYYYFKTKDDIVAAIVRARADELESAISGLEQRHRSPKARLKAMVRLLAERTAATPTHYGCPYGTLGSELAKQVGRPDTHPAPMMRILLEWTERQFHAMGRRDAPDLAVEMVAAYQGSAVLTSTLDQPDVMARQARRLQRWIDALGT